MNKQLTFADGSYVIVPEGDLVFNGYEYALIDVGTFVAVSSSNAFQFSTHHHLPRFVQGDIHGLRLKPIQSISDTSEEPTLITTTQPDDYCACIATSTTQLKVRIMK